MTSAEIRADLLAAGFPEWVPVFYYDASYAKPTVNWLLNKFWPYFRQQRFDLGLHKWTRKNDCDDWAQGYVYNARVCHAVTNGEDAEGLAVGEWCYVGTSHVQGAHAIVIAITDEGVVWIEPQTGQRLALTPTEIKSCFRCSF